MIRWALASCIGLWGLTLVAHAQTPDSAMSLETVYGYAMDEAPSLAIARYRVDSAEAQKAVARGSVLPQMTLFGEWTENTLTYDGPLSAIYGEQEYPGERYGITARQTIFSMSRFRELQRRHVLVDLSIFDLAQAEIDLLRAVTEGYLTVFMADNTVRQFQAEAEALENQLEEAEALYARALLPVTQVLEIRTRVEAVRADLIQAEGDLAIARERLTELIGVRRFELMPISENVSLSSNTTDVEQAVQQALQNSPAVSAAKENLEAARLGVKKEQGNWWPEVSVVFNQQYSDVGFDNLTSPPRTTESIGIAVTYPLLQGGAGSAKIRGAWAEYYAAKEELEAVSRSVERQTRASWVRLAAADKRVEAAQQALESASVNVFATQKSVKAGTARVTDVLFALAQRTRAQRDRTFAQQQTIIAWLDLELFTGRDPQMVVPELSDALLSSAPTSALEIGQ
jgi:outer membrane protein